MDLLESIQAAPLRADELAQEGERLYQAACTYPPITSLVQAEIYASELLEIKDARAFIHAEKLKVTGPIRAALTAANAHFNRADSPYESRELVLKGHLGQWQIAQRKAQEAAQRELEAKARAEREQLRAQAEEKERKAIAAATEAPASAAALAEESADLRQQALRLVAPVVAELPKLAGISHRGTWKLQLISEPTLREFVHSHPEFHVLFPYDPKAGDALARNLKDKLRLPGTELQFIPVVSAGRSAP